MGKSYQNHEAGSADLNWGALQESVGLSIRLAETVSAQAMSRLLGAEKLTAAQLTTLELIGSNPGVQPGRLARAMALEPSNLASLLRRLEAAGLVQTAPGRDKRTRVVTLTAAGVRARADGARLMARHQRTISKRLNADEQHQLVVLLKKVAANSD